MSQSNRYVEFRLVESVWSAVKEYNSVSRRKVMQKLQKEDEGNVVQRKVRLDEETVIGG